MRLSLVTAPTEEPLTLLEAQLRLKAEEIEADEPLVTDLIAAAREEFERETGRQVVTATWRLDLDAFPCDGEPIEIPRAPLLAVSAITYLDGDGVEQTWSAAEYTVRPYAGPYARCGRVYPAPGYVYPTTYAIPDAVRITFTAGYGVPGDVPQSVRAAVAVLLADRYQFRESQVAGTIIARSPAADRALEGFRLPVYA